MEQAQDLVQYYITDLYKDSKLIFKKLGVTSNFIYPSCFLTYVEDKCIPFTKICGYLILMLFISLFFIKINAFLLPKYVTISC